MRSDGRESLEKVRPHAILGLRIPEICEITGLHAATVAKCMKLLGVRAPRSRLAKHIPLIKQMYESGSTIQQIADHLGDNQKAVNKAMKRAGIDMRRTGPKSGEGHPEWKGGRNIDKDGYILIYCPDHPYARNSGYVLEHRLVMEDILGRTLLPHEVVHHKDDCKSNNSSDNLQVFSSNADHLAETLKGKTPQWTPEGQDRILAGIEKAAEINRNASRRPVRATDAPQSPPLIDHLTT